MSTRRGTPRAADASGAGSGDSDAGRRRADSRRCATAPAPAPRRRCAPGSRGRLPADWFTARARHPGRPRGDHHRRDAGRPGRGRGLRRRAGRRGGGPDPQVPRGNQEPADRDRARGRAPVPPQGLLGRHLRPVTEMFTTLSVPVMTRLRQSERRVLDTLVDAGVARSRSDALAWCVRLTGENADSWLSRLRDGAAARGGGAGPGTRQRLSGQPSAAAGRPDRPHRRRLRGGLAGRTAGQRSAPARARPVTSRIRADDPEPHSPGRAFHPLGTFSARSSR